MSPNYQNEYVLDAVFSANKGKRIDYVMHCELVCQLKKAIVDFDPLFCFQAISLEWSEKKMVRWQVRFVSYKKLPDYFINEQHAKGWYDALLSQLVNSMPNKNGDWALTIVENNINPNFYP